MCSGKTRIVVPERHASELIDRIVALMDSMPIGDPLDPATQIGPLVSKRQRDRVADYLAIGQAEGARIVRGGDRPLGLDRGWFIDPTLFVDVDRKMRIAQEEIFGPVVCVIPFDTEDEAVAIANGTEFGLATSIWTRDIARGHRVAHRLLSGITWINDHHRIDPASPWGGFKMSGIGRENGLVAYEEYTQIQNIIVNLSDAAFDWYADDGQPKRYS